MYSKKSPLMILAVPTDTRLRDILFVRVRFQFQFEYGDGID